MTTLMITGGTGTLGHGLVERLLQKSGYTSIRILSRGEHAQNAMRRKFADPRLRFVITDVRDSYALCHAMRGCHHVIHAAALKDVYTAKDNPMEVDKTNISGSANVVMAARQAGVERCVLVSSDKAFEPVNLYGTSKKVAEHFFLAANDHRLPTDPLYSVTRYGNVWCSAGSVVPVWRAELARGVRPVVRNLECTRFFMLLTEAVDLVLATLSQMPPEPAIPILPAYRLGTLVEAMDIKEYDVGEFDPSVEKLHESMGPGMCSKDARMMSVEEIRSHL